MSHVRKYGQCVTDSPDPTSQCGPIHSPPNALLFRNFCNRFVQTFKDDAQSGAIRLDGPVGDRHNGGEVSEKNRTYLQALYSGKLLHTFATLGRTSLSNRRKRSSKAPELSRSVSRDIYGP